MNRIVGSLFTLYLPFAKFLAFLLRGDSLTSNSRVSARSTIVFVSHGHVSYCQDFSELVVDVDSRITRAVEDDLGR